MSSAQTVNIDTPSRALATDDPGDDIPFAHAANPPVEDLPVSHPAMDAATASVIDATATPHESANDPNVSPTVAPSTADNKKLASPKGDDETTDTSLVILSATAAAELETAQDNSDASAGNAPVIDDVNPLVVTAVSRDAAATCADKPASIATNSSVSTCDLADTSAKSAVEVIPDVVGGQHASAHITTSKATRLAGVWHTTAGNSGYRTPVVAATVPDVREEVDDGLAARVSVATIMTRAQTSADNPGDAATDSFNAADADLDVVDSDELTEYASSAAADDTPAWAATEARNVPDATVAAAVAAPAVDDCDDKPYAYAATSDDLSGSASWSDIGFANLADAPLAPTDGIVD